MAKQRSIEIQISARVTRPKGKGAPKITAQLIRDAIRYRLDHDADPPGIELRIVAWRKAHWTEARSADDYDQDAVWRDFAPILRGRIVGTLPVRRRAGTGDAETLIL